MKSNRITQLLHDDEQRIHPNADLQRRITSRFNRSPLSLFRLWRVITLVGATAVVAVAFVSFNGLQSKGTVAFIAQANAAYENLRAKLSESGAVRHTVVRFFNYPDPSTRDPGHIGEPSETWSTSDGTTMLSGPLGAPEYLRVNGTNFMNSALYEEYYRDDLGSGSGETITTNADGSWSSTTYNSEDTGPKYALTTPTDTASWDQQSDPDDFSVACVNITPLTHAQKTARDSMDAINAASDAVATGTGGPEALLNILSSSSAVEDKGIQHDNTFGDLHAYRVTYDSALSALDTSEIGKKGFKEFGFSPDTYFMRVIRSGHIDVRGIEFTENVMTIITDEVLPADRLAEDFFSPTRLGFVPTPPSDSDHPENLPSFILHNGCYRQGIDEPEWLNAADEAAARARIVELGDQAPSMGGGGF